jgi:hypothetical protein
MDDGVDSVFEEFCEKVLPGLDIDPDDDDAVAKAFDEWINDEDFYLL